MASTTFPTNNDEDSDPFVIRRTWSSDDDNTEVAGQNRGTNEREEREILVKWQLPGNYVLPDAKKKITGLLTELLMCFPREVILVDHNSREWLFTETADDTKFSADMDKAAIKIYPSRDRTQKIIKWIVITKFRTTRELREWKDNEYFYHQVQEAKIYMFPHPFKYTEWDISSIGFIKDIHVAHYHQEHLHTMIQKTIEKQEKQYPTFQLIPQRITNKEKTASTRAYTVQCVKSDSRQLIHLLTHGAFREQPIFIPFKYKTTQPDIFTQCIRQQNEVYHKTWVIKMEGISHGIMEHIQDDLLQFAGSFHVVPTRRIHETGEWKLLVDHTKCAFIHNQLTSNWQTIISKIPEVDLAAVPLTFSFPHISSQKVRNYQDESSDSDSYGSILTTGTERSEGMAGLDEDDQFNDPPPQYNFQSYASVTAKSTSSHESPQMSSPTVSTTHDWQTEKSELEVLIRQQTIQIEQIQADLDAKVSRSKDLEEQLAQAIELAHSRDARHEEMLQKFEALMSRYMETQTQDSNHPFPPPPPPPPAPPIVQGDQVTHTQVTPPTRPMTTQSPPPKKSNQSQTPPKTMYPVFRQAEATQSKFKRPQTLLTQPMDTDDERPIPIPGVQAGTNQK